MTTCISRFRSVAPLAFVLLVCLVVASCASRPPPMQRALIVSVVSVSVSSASASDNGFAGDLEAALAGSVGRASQDIGRAAQLRVYVREQRRGISGYNAVVDIELTALDNGRLLYIGTSRKFGSTPSSLIEVIVHDVRRLVGVSGSAPVAVYSPKKPVVHPATKPDLSDLPTAAEIETISVADPLLNGTFTPDSDVLDNEEILSGPPVIDTSKPLLAKEIPVPKSAPAKPQMTTPVTPKREDAKPVPTEKPAVANPPVTDDTSAADEPCIVTVDKECKDPDE